MKISDNMSAYISELNSVRRETESQLAKPSAVLEDDTVLLTSQVADVQASNANGPVNTQGTIGSVPPP